MLFYHSISAASTKHVLKCVAPIIRCSKRAKPGFNCSLSCSARLASGSARTSRARRAGKHPAPIRPGQIEPQSRSRQDDASTSAALLLAKLRNANKASPKAPSPAQQSPKTQDAEKDAQEFLEALSRREASQSVERKDVQEKPADIDPKEQEILKQIEINRKKSLWPGIWTFFAVTGTYLTLAYIDAHTTSSIPDDDSALPSQAELPQTWYLTPEVIQQGIKAGWNSLDKLTIGIAVACIAVQCTRNSRIRFWEKLLHITGERKWTAFTYPLVHNHWSHLASNVFGLCWFLPGVVQHFDGDLFHSAAFLVSVPLITSYLQHIAFRLVRVDGFPLNMGLSGAIAAAFGAYAVLHPDEKIWAPTFLVLRLDAKYWAALFVLHQFYLMAKIRKGGNRPAAVVHLVSLGLGAAYVYFNGKENIWNPLVNMERENTTLPPQPS